MSKRARLRLVTNDVEDATVSRRPRRGVSCQRQETRIQSADRQPPYSKELRPKSEGQARLMAAIDVSDVVMAVGPAGTGKTHVAVRKAVEALKAGQVKRIVLARPAVEAGERLGFMPGGPEDKLDPYMRPLYDELMTCIPPQVMKAWLAERVLEIAPIGFMRGRTFTDSFVVVDEAQNMTAGQLKMVLTRIGFGSRMVVTGDPEQSDLLPGESGLATVADRVEGKVSGVAIVRLDGRDVVRHPVVKAMLEVLAA